jgi:hypothetical protein
MEEQLRMCVRELSWHILRRCGGILLQGLWNARILRQPVIEPIAIGHENATLGNLKVNYFFR